MTLEEVLDVLRELAPEDSALSDDPVGLLVAPESPSRITRIGVCLDATPETALHAVERGIQLLIAHHPLIYHPLRTIAPAADPISLAVSRLVKADIALYAMHTNWDRAAGGINDVLATCLELANVRPLGTENAVALPRIGDLATPRPLADFLRFVEETLACTGTSALRCSFIDPATMISRVAVCGGAGAFLASEALAAGAQAYVTSDVRHHEFLDASARGLALIDAGHSATETPGMHALAALLTQRLPSEITTVFVGRA